MPEFSFKPGPEQHNASTSQTHFKGFYQPLDHIYTRVFTYTTERKNDCSVLKSIVSVSKPSMSFGLKRKFKNTLKMYN